MEVKSRIYLLRERKLLSKRDRRGPEWVAKDSAFSRDFYRVKSWDEMGSRWGKLGTYKADGHKWDRVMVSQ